METEGQNPKDDDIDEEGECNDSDSSGDFEATKKKLAKFKNGMAEGDEDGDYGDESDDSDYEVTGGDNNLYDSKLDEIDEL